MLIGDLQELHIHFTEEEIPSMANDDVSMIILRSLSYEILSIMNKRVAGDSHEVTNESPV